MLKEMLEKIDCSNDVDFENASVVLAQQGSGRIFHIAFGDGTNSDCLEEGCDDYLYLTIDEIDDDGMFNEDVDGGQMDFNRKSYNGKINDYKMICDALDFLGCTNVDSLVLLKKTN